MDLTKEVHGGQFDSEEVENAKTVGRILMVLLSVSGVLIAYRGVSVKFGLSYYPHRTYRGVSVSDAWCWKLPNLDIHCRLS